MNRINFVFKNKDNISINAYKWVPKQNIKGIIQISHGMNEHILRYDYFGQQLANAGYLVYGHDHRGHGKSTTSLKKLGYISDNDGFMDMVEDLKLMTDIIKKENSDEDIFMFSHSMGSFLAQRYIQIYGGELKGAILSGTNGEPPFLLNLGIIISKIAMKFKGRQAKIKLIDTLSFSNYNKKFQPERTEFDWLSRDMKEVDKYIEDPYCGNLFPVSFFYDLYMGLKSIHKNEYLKNIPKDLPIYIFGGTADPVGEYGKGIVNLYNIYKALNIENVNYKLYKDGRHEMLNEINKDLVIKDILDWLDNNKTI